MRIILPAFLVALSACSSPSRQFSDATPQRIAIEGKVFDIYRAGNEVEVIRTNPMVLPDTSRVMAAAVIAVEARTGCQVRNGSVKGDAAIVRMRLTCRK